MIKLFVGLGNPGPEYEATRHNAGFWWIDALARELKVTLQPERGYWGLAARATVQGQAVWLLQPQTFMNLSGKSVSALARFFKIAPDEILVAHDELDIAPGQASDYTGALPLLDAGGPEPKVLLADRGYDADAIRTEMEARGVTPIIPMRRNRKVQLPVDDHVYALRNRIERCFNRLKNWRRLATRYDKTADSYLGFVLIAAVRLWTRAFVNRT